MKLKSFIFLGISFLSNTIWADYSGHYTCEFKHRGKHDKANLDVKVYKNTYRATLTWPKRSSHFELVPTQLTNIYLHKWHSKNSLGIASWDFKNSHTNMHGISYDLTDGKKYHEQLYCKKNNSLKQ